MDEPTFVNRDRMNCYYQNQIDSFLSDNRQNILGQLTLAGGNDPNQVNAWEIEIDLLKTILKEWKNEAAEVIFEYTIPRLNKRVDVILLLKNIIFCIEFKVGQSTYLQQDMEQVMDYALDLKNFHKESHFFPIVPILVATEANVESDVLRTSVYNDQIYNPLLVNSKGLYSAIKNVIIREQLTPADRQLNISNWCISRYEPTPTIIEAAKALYNSHSVENITRSEASGESLRKTTDYILNVINQSREKNEKSICFVTGVPGAGKTLVGLNVAIEQSDTENAHNDLAVYLSGNGPLV